MKRLKIVGCFAWAGVAVSSVTSANAIAATQQDGAWASCSSAYDHASKVMCDMGLSYIQIVKLSGPKHCTGADCWPALPFVYTDAVYAPGRYLATPTARCGNWNVYELGACAC